MVWAERTLRVVLPAQAAALQAAETATTQPSTAPSEAVPVQMEQSMDHDDDLVEVRACLLVALSQLIVKH